MSAGSAFVVLNVNEITIETVGEDLEILEPCMLQVGQEIILSSGAFMAAEWMDLDEDLRKRILDGDIDPFREAYLAIDGFDRLQVRSWISGDRFYPLGAPGRKKLQDWFIDRHVPCRERKLLPVVLTERSEIIWIPGFPPAEKYRIERETTRALRLTYRGRTSPSFSE